jgi:hypothetical protein
VDDVHDAHGAAGVVEDPLLLEVQKGRQCGVGLEGADDVVDDEARVVAVRGNGRLGGAVEVARVENGQFVEVGLGGHDDGQDHRDDDDDVGDDAHGWLIDGLGGI